MDSTIIAAAQRVRHAKEAYAKVIHDEDMWRRQRTILVERRQAAAVEVSAAETELLRVATGGLPLELTEAAAAIR